ncbi:MAG: hypothetical protein V4710_03535, partial [Verrucomicrobiota bacterium]
MLCIRNSLLSSSCKNWLTESTDSLAPPKEIMSSERYVQPKANPWSSDLDDPVRARESRAKKVRVIVQKMSKKDLVDLVCRLATDNPAIADGLLIEAADGLGKEDLIPAIRAAIKSATYVPGDLINCSFSWDDAAYDRIEKGLEKLMSLGRTEEAMQLAVEVMKSGSAQIELSDVGDMLNDVVRCICVV